MEELQPLDDNFNRMELPLDSPIFPIILKYGLIGSAIMLPITAIQFATASVGFKEDLFTSILASVLTSGVILLVYIGIMTLAILKYKKTNDGFASLGKAFLVTFLTGLMIAVASTIFSMIMMFVFGYNAFGMNEFNSMDEGFSGTSMKFWLIFLSSLSSLLFSSMAGAIVALIISAITKKERPLNFNHRF